MLTFDKFLADAATKGEAVNILFEQRLFELVGILHKIANPLTVEGIPYELIGGLAVLVHVEEADPTQTSLTRDVDLLVNRSDLERIKEVAAQHGFRFRHSASLDMLLYGETDRARNAVHLIFSGEKVRPNQAVPNPPIAPIRKQIHGSEVMVIRMADLLRMKLSSFRLKDQVHIQTLDIVGLITPDIEQTLPVELLTRLQQVRRTE